uniref:Ig-like domain-containing protein n=1 Tax=Oreochromis niloticus TaxID=8128 RepID=A0A669C203_ORENI
PNSDLRGLLNLISSDISFKFCCQHIQLRKEQMFSVEGSTVTLSYRYSKAAVYDDYFFWYRQYPGKPPEFLISHSGTGEKILNPVTGLTVKAVDNNRQMTLQISSAAVTDSAVYYCAVRPTVTGNTKLCTKTFGAKTTEYSTTSTRGSHTLCCIKQIYRLHFTTFLLSFSRTHSWRLNHSSTN